MEVHLNSKQLKHIIQESIKEYLKENDNFHIDNLTKLNELVYNITGIEYDKEDTDVDVYIEALTDVYKYVNGYNSIEDDEITVKLPTPEEFNNMLKYFNGWLESYYDEKIIQLNREYRFFTKKLNNLIR